LPATACPPQHLAALANGEDTITISAITATFSTQRNKPIPKVVEKEKLIILAFEDIHFDFDDATLNPEAAPQDIYSSAAKANMRVLFEVVVK
jgi:outer membrane protein OmpA-like peptidoglycan-associated protein